MKLQVHLFNWPLPDVHYFASFVDVFMNGRSIIRYELGAGIFSFPFIKNVNSAKGGNK